MKQTEIEEKIIEEASDWNIIRGVVNSFKQEEISVKQQEVQRKEAQEKARERRYNSRPQMSSMGYHHMRMRQMRVHNDTVARYGYGSSYF